MSGFGREYVWEYEREKVKRVQPVICIEMLFDEKPAHEKIPKIAGEGFGHVEFWGWRDKDLDALNSQCRRHGVGVANFSAHRTGNPVAAETHDAVLSDFSDALKAAELLECRCLMFLSNELGEGGRVVHSYSEIPDDTKLDNMVSVLKEADRLAPPEMNLVIEPLNIEIDHPGNFLKDMDTAVKIADATKSDRIKVLCDFYHMGVMGFDLESIARDYADRIGYVHIADVPGRNEPGTGSVDWPRILGALGDAGYDGYVGFEYAPAASSAESLKAVMKMWKRAVRDG